MKLIKKSFLFMRHGETQANQDKLFCGATDLPLNDVGRRQAIHAREQVAALDIDQVTVISSPMIRAQETTQLTFPDTEFLTEADLSERDWGEWEIKPLAEPTAYLDTPPGGEPWEVFINRVTSALNRILTQYPQPLIVAHSGVYRAIQFHLTGSPSGPRIPNATLVYFSPKGDGWQQQTIKEQNTKENIV